MKCLKDVNWVKAEWRSSMKNHFHGFGGLGAYTKQAKNAFCTYKCTACQLAKKMLRELSLLAKYAKEF